MGKNIVRVTSNKQDAIREKNAINKSFLKRNIKRKAYLTNVSQDYVRRRTRAGYRIRKKNYAIAVRNK